MCRHLSCVEAHTAQWAMIGVSAIIFVLLPETPWYLVSKGKLDQAKKVLTKMHGRKQGYDSQEQVVSHTSLEVSTFELI